MTGQPGSALLLKTENGQYRLLHVGPAQGQQAQPTIPNSGANQTIRIQTVPSVSRFTGPPLALRKTIVTQQPMKTKANININQILLSLYISRSLALCLSLSLSVSLYKRIKCFLHYFV